MSTTRLHSHHSLPAPVVHSTFSAPQSKSHVLAGVQDAYWSDDEAEDAECPLCLEEMDISDLNFKPCICGYQICRFCWHHIKENLNQRCPACRRIYTDDAIEFKPIATQDHKRLTQQKKQRDRERKDLEALGRRHLANVRVVQRNVVYVVGIGPRFAKEELIPTLRSNEYFGQYGKITKILLVKRNSPGSGGPVLGLYITYNRREDAARAIAVVDGSSSPGGSRDVMRASYGTTKYCMAFLRGVACGDHSCMNLHEWGDEKDCFTKEDLTTLKHTMKATESRSRTVTTKKGDEDAGLPRAASWAQKGSNNSHLQLGSNMNSNSSILASTSSTTRQTRRTGVTRLSRNPASTTTTGSIDNRSAQVRSIPDRKAPQGSTSRPSTPAPVEPNPALVITEVKTMKQKEATTTSQLRSSPAPSATTASDIGSTLQESVPKRPDSVGSSQSNLPTASSKILNIVLLPPGLAAPPGLSAPPGIPSPSRPPRAETASPQTPLLASQTSYQMSTAARALLDDVKARRESALPLSSAFSPFPDFDRTLQTLSAEGGGGFSFNLDPKLADEAGSADHLPDFDATSTIPFHGSYMDAFPALRSGSPYLQSPSLGYLHSSNHPIYDPSVSVSEKQPIRGTSYLGSFNPFSDPSLEGTPSSSSSPLLRSQYSPIDEERKVSRFGFARGRQNSTATSSPLHSVSPLSYSNDPQPFYQMSEEANLVQPWPPGLHDLYPATSHPGSFPESAQAQPTFIQHRNRAQPVNGDLSEAQLRSFIQSSQEREIGGNNPRNATDSQQALFVSGQPFDDPAIMSAGFAAPATERVFASMGYGPPPGLPVPQRLSPSPAMTQVHQNGIMDARSNSTQVPTAISSASPTLLSSEDFPALASVSSDPSLPTAQTTEPEIKQPSSPSKSQEKAERKAAKKAAAAEKALERQKMAQEKAEAKAAEKAKVAKEKAAEKERAPVLLKSQQVENPTEEKAETSATSAIVENNPNVRPEMIKVVRQGVAVDRPLPSKKMGQKAAETSTVKRQDQATSMKPSTRTNASIKAPESPKVDATSQVPLLSKKPKKNKPIVKTVKVPKEDDTHEELTLPSATDTSRGPAFAAESSSSNSRAQSVDQHQTPTSIQDILAQIDAINPGMDLATNPFFDLQRLASPAKMPLEYGPLVHALSALSVGGGSFANNMPSGSIDNAVSSFQQLLETLTQTISDLLRLLPRTTWDDSSSFDGVLRDMLKGDDFLDDGEDGAGRDDEVAALTLALERRARWMEVQLSKLEELHRDINTAAVRAVLSFNDSGWDKHGFLPRIGNTLRRFDNIGMVEEQGETRSMTADELDKKLLVAKEAAIFAETEIREAMEKIQSPNVLLWS